MGLPEGGGELTGSWGRDSCVTLGGSTPFTSMRTRVDHSPCATRQLLPHLPNVVGMEHNNFGVVGR